MVRIAAFLPFAHASLTWSVSLVPLCAQQPVVAPRPAHDAFVAARAARDGGRYGMLLRQFRADEPALGERHEAGFRDAMPRYGDQRDLPAAHWVWARPFWFLFRDGPAGAPAPAQWSPEQACGAPDTPAAGDHPTAWATREQDGPDEWLLLEFAAPVRAAKLAIHESHCPGAVARVSIFDDAGGEIEVWRAPAVAAAAEPARTLRIDLPLGFSIDRVRLHLDSATVPGWNEIDAVGLVDDRGGVHWAARAEASSTFAETTRGARVGGVALRAGAPPAVAPPPPAPIAATGPAPATPAAIAQLEAEIAALEARLAAARARLAALRSAKPK